jgi:hypothetical protein
MFWMPLRTHQEKTVDAAQTRAVLTAVSRAAQNALLQISGDFVDLAWPATVRRRRIAAAECARLARLGVDDG